MECFIQALTLLGREELSELLQLGIFAGTTTHLTTAGYVVFILGDHFQLVGYVSLVFILGDHFQLEVRT